MSRFARLSMFLLGCWLALWGLASFAVPRLVDAVLASAMPTIQRAGITLDSLDFSDIRVSPTLTRVRAYGVAVAFDLSPTDEISLSSTFEAREISVGLAWPALWRGDLRIDDFEISFHESDRPQRLFFDRLTHAYVHIEDLPLLSPRSAMVEIISGLEDLFDENTLVGNLEFRGDAVIRIHDLAIPAELYTERQGERFRLRFQRTDIESLAAAAEVDLSAQQIEILSLFPLRVPSLIEITRQARSLSTQHYARDRWLRDALRHVAWSYLLTREFGPEFAQEVTDAQEAKPGNTPNERSMDFHNNAVGRLFADNGTRLADLPGLVQSHPDVIRHPNDVGSRTELWQ